MRPGGLPVLTYHAIDTSGAVTATDPSWFTETLHALSEAGCRCVDLHDWIAAGRPEVERGYALTFDDGLHSILQIADVVARFQARATVFLVTDRIGGDNAWPGQPAWVPRSSLLDWPEIEALQALGFRFGAHGKTHLRLDRCDDASLVDELRGSRFAVEDRLGQACSLFAYPYGIAPPRVRRAASRTFLAAFGTSLGLANAGQSAHRLSRIDAYYLRSERALKRLTTGRWQSWLQVRRTLRNTRRFVAEPIIKLADSLATPQRVRRQSPSISNGRAADWSTQRSA